MHTISRPADAFLTCKLPSSLALQSKACTCTHPQKLSGLCLQVAIAGVALCTAAVDALQADVSSPVQIYVEIERARLTRRLARIQEAEGQVSEAADTLQEIAVVCALAVGSAPRSLKP